MGLTPVHEVRAIREGLEGLERRWGAPVNPATMTRRARRRWCGAVVGVAVAVLLAGCSGTQSGGDDVVDTGSGIDIGSGRVIDVQCAGTGSPTVILVSGSRGAGDSWRVLPKPGATEITVDTVEPSPDSVFDRLAATTRVCSYDRPGTQRFDGSTTATTPVAQPTSAMQGADDLQAWLVASGEPMPVVLVAHSWGGLIATTFAHDHPDEVAALVLVDPGSRYLAEELDDAGWQAFLATTDSVIAGDSEAPDYRTTLADPDRTLPTRPVPTIVISSDEEFDFGAGDANWPAWAPAQERIAEALGAQHITQTDSGHLIPLTRPELVVDAVSDVLAQTSDEAGTSD